MQSIGVCRFVLLTATLLAATPLLAEERCLPSETATQCLERYLAPKPGVPGAMEPYVQRAMKKEWNDLQRQPTGVDTGGDSIATNTKDFNPLMALAGLLGTDTDGASDPQGTVVFNFNFPLHTTGAKNTQLQALVNTQPQLFELVRNAIPEPDRDERIPRLEEQIGSLADHTIRFTYNFTSRSLGRSFEQYKQDFGKLCEGAMKGAVKWQQDPVVAMGGTLEDLSLSVPFKDMPAEMVAEAMPLVAEKARQVVDFQDQVLREAGVDSYDQLVDNQPQLYITAEKRFREPLVGTDDLSVVVTYEWSLTNLNAVTERCGPDSDWGSPDCIAWYRKYVKDNKKAIDAANRFSFRGEYVESDGESIDAGLAAPIVIDGFRKLVLSAGWSRKFALGDGEPFRLDLVASYEDVSDDPLRQDRGIASLTFTRKVGNMDIPFGIVYANHPEFLPDVDARLSAHLGLKFNMSGGDGNQ